VTVTTRSVLNPLCPAEGATGSLGYACAGPPSLGTALVGSVLVAVKLPDGKPFAVALTMMLVIALIGLVIAALIPRQSAESSGPPSSAETAAPKALGGQVS
jgi:hypothetical protein